MFVSLAVKSLGNDRTFGSSFDAIKMDVRREPGVDGILVSC
jgi:hypothetical protein